MGCLKNMFQKKIIIFLIPQIFIFASLIFAGERMAIHNRLDQIRVKEPSFSEITAAAFKIEKLDLNRVDEWKKKIKSAPWLPTLSFGYDRALRSTSAISITDNISVSSDNVTVGPQEGDLDQSVFQGDLFRVRAVWSLDEVIFHPSTLQISQEGREISKSRLQTADYLFKIYSKRRELLGEYYLAKNSKSEKSLIEREQIFALTEQLDSFTGGIFTARWWRGE